MKLPIKTKKNNFEVEVFSGFIRKEEVDTDKKYFDEFCRNGCKNFGKKYSCPPFAPSFQDIAGKQGLFVVLLRCDLNQINSTPYNKIRIANVVMKSKLEKLMRELETKFNTVFLSNGSCRLCRTCMAKKNIPCKYPDKKRYSLEATGVNCNKLAEKMFGFNLEWYGSKQINFTCILSGLVCDESEVGDIKKEIYDFVYKSL